MNQKQATIAGLIALGFVEEVRSRKYRCFNEPVPQGVPFVTYLVGKSGALRKCRVGNNTIANSVSLTDSVNHKALAYVGVAATVQPDLTQEKLSEIYRSEVDRLIQLKNKKA